MPMATRTAHDRCPSITASDTVPDVGRPATGKTFIARQRVPLETWEAFGEATAAVGTDRSKVINEFIDWYLRKRGAQLPARPTPGRTPD